MSASERFQALVLAVEAFEDADRRHREALDALVAVAKRPGFEIAAFDAAQKAGFDARADRDVAAMMLARASRSFIGDDETLQILFAALNLR